MNTPYNPTRLKATQTSYTPDHLQKMNTPYDPARLKATQTSYTPDHLQFGIARGCGWQKIGAFVNLESYDITGVPTSALLAFVFHIGGKGLWVGIICALFVQDLVLLVIVIRTDWEKEVPLVESSKLKVCT